MASESRRAARIRRHARVRKTVHGTAERPRLSVFRSLNHIYAQVIDDTAGCTLVAASTLDPELKAELDGKNKKDRSQLVGSLLGKRAIGAGVSQVAFDRGGSLEVLIQDDWMTDTAIGHDQMSSIRNRSPGRHVYKPESIHNKASSSPPLSGSRG